MPVHQWGSRSLRYVLGLYLLALGGAFSIIADLGTTSVNALPLVLSIIFQTHLKFWVAAVMGLYLLVQSLVNRSFHPLDILQIGVSFFYGVMVDLNLALLSGITLSSLPWRWAALLLGIALVALGISIYVSARYLRMPTEGLITALARRYPKRWPLHRAKILSDSVSVLLSILLGLLFLGEIRGVGIGTVLSALLIGRCIFVVQKIGMYFNKKFSPSESLEEKI